MANAEIILTDLPEVEEIVTSNLSQAVPEAGSWLLLQQLDWDEDLPPHLLAQLNSDDQGSRLDLIIAADCTYNPDSRSVHYPPVTKSNLLTPPSPALVKTLCGLSKSSPDVAILIAMKKRHSSEDIFFDLMSNSGFALVDTMGIPLPGDEESGEETVYVNRFRYATDV